MAKTLGAYIRFVPEEDQETIVGVLKYKRDQIHRGMLCFIPTTEILSTLRNAHVHYLNHQQNLAMQAQQQMNNQLYQYPNTGYGSGYFSQGSGGGGGLRGLQSLSNLNTKPYNIPIMSNDSIHFAYAAVIAAMAIQKKDEEAKELSNESDITEEPQTLEQRTTHAEVA